MAGEPPVGPFYLRPEQARRAFVFFSYAHQDKRFRDRLEDHLSILKYRGLIATWHDREIRAGEEWGQQIDIYLNKAHIILLLISSDFMASEYCYSIEMKRALELHEQRKADVIPILVRPVLYTDAPFAKFQMLPTNRKPIIRWRDRDSAFFDIACGIERVAQKYSASPSVPLPSPLDNYPPPSVTPLPPPDIPYQTFGRGTTQDERPQQPISAQRRHLPLLPIGVGVFVVGLIIAGIFALLQHPTLIPLVIYLFIGLLLLIAGIVVVRKVIGAIRARNEQRRAQEAPKAAQRYIQEAPEAAQIQTQEAPEAAHKRWYYGEAIAAYRRALSRNPSDGDAHRGMGNALYALGYYDQALDAFTRAIDCDSTPAAYAGLGDVFARLKRPSEAVSAYEKAIELDPTVTLNYDDLMRSLWALGRKEEAEQIHARAKQLGYEDEE